jgi:two-component system, OmpR family, sensor histidine kinase SenX3
VSARPRTRRREVVEAIEQGAVLLSDRGQVLAINDTARSLLGLPPEARARTAKQVLTSPALVDAVEEVTETRRAISLDLDHDGARLRASVSLVRDEVLLLLTDRTEEHRVEQLRRDFVANTSHELKTPVAAIQTLAEALAVVADEQPDRIPALVARLNGEATRLATLVYDLLDLRRLEERGPSERAAVDLAEVVRRVVADRFDRAQAAGIEVVVEAPDHLEVPGARGDLEMVVQNLLSNAITYNHEGGRVTVTVRTVAPDDADGALEDGDAGAAVELVVEDTGIGIPEQDLDRVFERFYRVDTARSRTTGGTGLGLSIVRHAVEHHHGSIELTSEAGVGTRCVVRLPATEGALPTGADDA